MTRDQIIAKWNALSPRERDAWVAEVVFGYETYGAFYEPNGVRILIPRYTEDIAAAWALIEGNEEWGVLDIDISFDPWSPGKKRVTVGAWVGGGFTLMSAETAPEALCLTAIIAKLSPAV